jgi:hypothetical protein
MAPYTDTPDGEVPIPETVFNQIEAIRDSGTHNMITEFGRAVEAYDFPELTAWYAEHSDEYFRATVGGEGFNVRPDHGGE